MPYHRLDRWLSGGGIFGDWLFLLVALISIQSVWVQEGWAQDDSPEIVGAITPFDCPITQVGYEIACAWLTVPEDYAQPDGATIRIAFATIFASTDDVEPDPVVFLNGGPGYGMIDTIQPQQLINTTGIRNRNVIVVDQRGTGLSQPSLYCPEISLIARQRLKDGTYRVGALEYLPEAGIQACYNRLVADGVNLPAFNTTHNAHDLDLLRETLGYEQWNITGVSYGTLLGLVMMREHGEHIRSAVLDSVIPPTVNSSLNEPYIIYHMLERFFTACAENELCQRAYPDLPQTLYEVLVRLESNPIGVGMKLDGDVVVIPFDDRSFMDYIFNQLYNDGTFRDLPATINLLGKGDPHLIMRNTPIIVDNLLRDTITHGTYLSIMCQEQRLPADYVRDTGALHPAVLNAMQNDAGIYVAPLDTPCTFWDVPPVDETFREPVISEIPTLLLVGALDPVTPPDFAYDAAQYLLNSTTIIFAGRGHGVGSTDCAPQLVQNFINDPTAPLDVTCTEDAQAPFFSIPRAIVDAAFADAIAEASAQLEERIEESMGLTLGVPLQWQRSETSNGNPQYIFEEATLTLYRMEDTTLDDAISAYGNDLRRTPRTRDTFTVGETFWTRYSHLEAGTLWSIVATLDDDGVVMVTLSAPATDFPEVAWEAMLDTLVLNE